MNTENEIHNLYQIRMNLYYKYREEKIKPNVVYVGHKQYADLRKQDDSVSYVVQSPSGQFTIFGLNIIRVVNESYLAVGHVISGERGE